MDNLTLLEAKCRDGELMSSWRFMRCPFPEYQMKAMCVQPQRKKMLGTTNHRSQCTNLMGQSILHLAGQALRCEPNEVTTQFVLVQEGNCPGNMRNQFSFTCVEVQDEDATSFFWPLAVAMVV